MKVPYTAYETRMMSKAMARAMGGQILGSHSKLPDNALVAVRVPVTKWEDAPENVMVLKCDLAPPPIEGALPSFEARTVQEIRV